MTHLLRRVAALGLGFILPILLFQLPYVLLEAKVGALPFNDYWTQLYERLEARHGLVWFHEPTELAREHWLVEGAVFSLLVALAWIVSSVRLVRHREPVDLFLLAYSLVPFLYFSSMKWGLGALPRTASLVWPIAGMCVGHVLALAHAPLAKRTSPRAANTVVVVVVAALLAQASPRLLRAGNVRSGYAEASAYLAETGKTRIFILGMEPIWRFYLGRVAVDPYQRPHSLEALLGKAQREGVTDVVLDYSSIHSRYGADYLAQLVGRLAPTATFANPRGVALPYLLDEGGLAYAAEVAADERSARIYVYEITDIAASAARGELR